MTYVVIWPERQCYWADNGVWFSLAEPRRAPYTYLDHQAALSRASVFARSYAHGAFRVVNMEEFKDMCTLAAL